MYENKIIKPVKIVFKEGQIRKSNRNNKFVWKYHNEKEKQKVLKGNKEFGWTGWDIVSTLRSCVTDYKAFFILCGDYLYIDVFTILSYILGNYLVI
jgi:hypothetical protein